MRKACSVPLVLVVLAFLSCLFLVHAASAAAVAGGNRRALLKREAAAVASGGQAVPTTAEVAAVGGELPLVADEEAVRRVDLQTEDYPGSAANSRHDPRNPH